jgi:hypothetical protein
MPFIWNTEPNSPSTDLPVPVPPGEISYEQREVANLVNAGGALSYNTPNIGFDIVYELASLNVRNLQVTTLNAGTLTINTARISAASINRASINTANFGNVTIQYGFMGSNPGSNLEIATKGYVDAAGANVPPGGSDLQNIIDAKGDVLVGIAANTATRLPVGSNGQVLTADSTTTTGLRWRSIAGSGTGSFVNLVIQTHYTPSLKHKQVILTHADMITLDDGISVPEWNNLVADITISGAGGLDVGVENPSRWYEILAIRKISDGTKAIIFHEASRIVLDQSLTTTTDAGITVRKLTGGTATKVSQSFVPANTGPLTSVELEVSCTGTPTGLIWVTLEADSGGFPSGTPLATSRIMDVARLPTDKARMRFLFDTNTSVSLGTTYHIVYQGDYTVSDTSYSTIWGVTAGGYASGSASEFRVAWFTSVSLGGPADLWFKTFIQTTPGTDATLPSGYDQKTIISYVYNDSSSNFKSYIQKDRMMSMGVSADWRAFTPLTGLVEAVDLIAFIPPLSSVVQFTIVQIGGQGTVPVGRVASTDMTGNTPSVGIVAANVSTGSGLSPGPFGEISVEDQVILTRMKNVASRLYVSLVRF